MGSVGNKQSWSVTRRDFLKTTGAIAWAVGLAPTFSAPFAPKALAETETLTRPGGHLYVQTNETQRCVALVPAFLAKISQVRLGVVITHAAFLCDDLP